MIEKQIELEKEMLAAGVARYTKALKTSEEAGRASETPYAQRLLPDMCVILSKAIQAFLNEEKKGVAGAKMTSRVLLKRSDPDTTALITMKVVFDSLIQGSKLTSMAVKLGQRVEDQIRFERFEQQNPDYYKAIIEDFKKKGTTAYRHKHRVLTNKANEHNDNWKEWTPSERVHVGAKLIELALLSTGLLKKVPRHEHKKKIWYIEPTEEALEWIKEHTLHASVLHPETAPCIVPPKDWTGMHDGGFYTEALQCRVPFVKTRSSKHRQAIKDADFSEPMAAVNELQKTPWRLNTQVHSVLKEVWRRNLGIGMPPSEPTEIPKCPLPKELKKADMTAAQKDQFMGWKRQAASAYTEEHERVSKCLQLARVLSMAEKYSSKAKFYFVYTCDFRGRVYAASPSFSPQGADFAKGLLHFHEAKELGETGAYWLAVQGSNVYGYDKDSYDGRVQWVNDNEQAILAVARDPLGSDERSFWANADKPYQFLAFCFEWAGYKREGSSFKSRLPIALDGSCNGIQNFSAMLRDAVGGAATNLVASEKPQDIYMECAKVCIRKLEQSDSEYAPLLLELGINRKITKKPVMTLPYGSTRLSCRDSVEAYLRKIEQSHWDSFELGKVASFLTAIIWDSIGEVVIAARAAMKWLQDASKIVSIKNEPLMWTTPTGFRVYQGTVYNNSQRIRTQLCGRA